MKLGGAAPRVAVITANYWPERTGTSQTVTEFATYLASRGVGVAVVTAMPYYPEWRIWPAYRGRAYYREETNGVVVFRSWHLVAPKPSTFARIVHELTLSVLAVPNMIRVLGSASAVYVVSPPLTLAFVGVLAAWLFGVRRVLVVKDVMPDAAVELGMLRNRVLIALSRVLAKVVYRWADEIHTLGEGMRVRIGRIAGATEKVKIVPDTIDGTELRPVPPEENEFRRRFVPAGCFAVLHTGNMGRKQDLELLLRAARCLRDEDPEVHFFVFGDGAVKEEFLAQRERNGLANVSHYPLQERWLVPHMLSGADLVVISQLPEVVDVVVPSKLITALGAGAMIVAACAPESEAAALIRASGGGMWIPASDDRALVDLIRRMRRREVDSDRYRCRAREFALRRFDRSSVYGPIADDHFADVA